MNEPRRFTGKVGVVILIAALFASAAGMLMILEQERLAAVRATELSYLPNGQYARVAVLGYRQAAADLIWLKALQLFGERTQTADGYRWAYHAVDVLTDLDPKFSFAYLAAGTILSVWAGQIEESIAILTKGMKHNPEIWQLPATVGYDYYFELCDPETAAEYFRAASKLPGAPVYLPKLAARVTVEAGSPDSALEFLEHFARQTSDERLREALGVRIKEVLAERDIRMLEKALRSYKARFGKWPQNLHQLTTQRFLSQLPVEPFGGAYHFDKTTGMVTSTGLIDRLRVHRQSPCRSRGRMAPIDKDETAAKQD